jgi:hypothetical protein
MRAIDCSCRHHFDAESDDEHFRVCRERVDNHRPEMERSDEQLRARIAADGSDVVAPATG